MPKIKKLFAEFIPKPVGKDYDTAARRLFLKNAPTPSAAIFAMVRGIKNQLKNDNFVINMSTFGVYLQEKAICSGCAATCAIIEISGYTENQVVDPDRGAGMLVKPSEVGRKIYDDNIHTLHTFEEAIDEVRKGDIYRLLYWYGFDWTKDIPQISAIISQKFGLIDSYLLGNEETQGDVIVWKKELIKFENLAKFMQKNGL